MGSSGMGPGSLAVLSDGGSNDFQSSGGLGGVQGSNFDGRYPALGGGGLNRFATLGSGSLGLQGPGMRDDEFAIQSEDFPALGGSKGPSGGSGRSGESPSMNGQAFTPEVGHSGQAQQAGMQGAVGGQQPVGGANAQNGGQGGQHQRHQQQGMQQSVQGRSMGQAEGWKLDGSGQAGGQSQIRGIPPQGVGGLSQLDGQGQGQGQSSSDQGQGQLQQQHSDPGVSKEVQYGLGGLIEVIKMSDKDLSALALGVDLLTLGLNLNSQDCLYSLFSSPFTDQPSNMETQYVTPQCYLMHPPQLKMEHLSKYKLETLFYMFYTSPHDIKQACAAQELYRREWRYHGELMIWLKPRGSQELMLGHPSVQFQFFDVSSWEPRLFTSAYRGNLVNGLLSEEDVRVKVPQGQGQAQAQAQAQSS
jgi:CCR4-NOT transcription complex subunit 2